MYAEVILDIKKHAINKSFDYAIPDHLLDLCERGMRVLIPFQHGKTLGIIISIKSDTVIEDVKSILDIDSTMPIINEKQFEIIEFLVSKYRLILPQAIDLVIPTVFHNKITTKVLKYSDEVDEDILDKFNSKGIWILKPSEKIYRKRLKQLSKLKKVDIIETIQDEIKEKKKYRYTISNHVLDTNLIRLNEVKKTHFKKNELLEYGLSDSEIKYHLKEKNIIKEVENIDITYKNFDNQSLLLKHLIGPLWMFKDHINAHINYVIQNKRTLLILVPKESILYEVQEIIDQEVLIYHSKLTAAQKRSVTRQLKHFQVVLSTRSGLFLPFNTLDHMLVLYSESEFYQLHAGVFYDTIDVIRSHFKESDVKFHQSFYTPFILMNYDKNDYEVRYVQPNLKLISMKDELIKGNVSILSHHLKAKIEETLSKDKKVFIIHQRKGYHLAHTCRLCGYVARCEQCQSVYHVTKHDTLYCTECSHEIPMIRTCPNHHDNMMKPIGIGNEYVVDNLKHIFKDYKVSHVDTMTKEPQLMIERSNIIVGTTYLSNFKSNLENGFIAFLVFDTLWQNPHVTKEYEALLHLLNFSNYTLNALKEPLVIQTYNIQHDIFKAIEHPQVFMKHYIDTLHIAMTGPEYMQYELYIDSTSYLKGYQNALKIKALLQDFAHIIGPRKRYEEENFFTLTIKVKQNQLKQVIEIFDHIEYEVKPL